MQRSIAASMRTPSKGRSSSSARRLGSTCAVLLSGPAVRPVPVRSALVVHLPRGGGLPHPQTCVLVAAEEAPEFGILVPRGSPERAHQVPPEHADAAVHDRVLR